jgi:hypothetical protein
MKFLHACLLVGLAACASNATSDDRNALNGSGGDSGSGSDTSVSAARCGGLPVDQIEQIIGAPGTVDNGVLEINVERTDIGDVQCPLGITCTPSFQVEADIYFQSVGHGRAVLNGDFALKESEVNPFIRALLENGLEWQAFHQHLPMQPQVWFVHYRGVGDPLALARDLRNAIDVTSVPLPQTAPPNPTTPLDPDRLASILHGTAMVGDEGVVTVSVPRKHGVQLDGVFLQPETGIENVIQFKPTGGSNADVIPDFSMTSNEIRPVVEIMLLQFNWFQGCLYNQETAERPQLFFDHMAKRGDAYQLAAEIRAGLDQTDAE